MRKRFWWFLPLALVAGLAWLSLVTVPRQALVVERIPLTTSPADVGLDYESFTVSPADTEIRLAGWWMPAPDPFATLVFIHGGGSNRHSEFFRSLRFYRAAVDAGMNVVAIDLRNHGESGSHAPGLQFGRTEHHDARAAIDWARARTPDLPLFAMGISMGGATIIHAAHAGAPVDGLVLLDPLLHTADVFKQGGWIQSGLPPSLFAPSAWAATTFFGLPGGDEQALERAAALDLPILLVQDPEDPVTRLPYARELAQRNPRARMWVAPPIDPADERLAWKERWGSHVAAFEFFPGETLGEMARFLREAAPGGAE